MALDSCFAGPVRGRRAGARLDAALASARRA